MFGFGKKIDINSINEEIKQGSAYLLDVRGNEEWDHLHAQNALHLSVERIMDGKVPTKDKTKKIYLYCRSGGRASMAATKLAASGYQTENIGGLNSWEAAGGATESGM